MPIYRISCPCIKGMAYALFSIILLLILSSCQTEPEPVSVTNIVLDTESLELIVGDSYPLKATVSPSNADNKTVLWSSSNSGVAKVTDGLVEAVSPGEARITATSDDGGKTATCSISVKARTYPVTGITLDKETMEALVGDAFTLTATVSPSNATNPAIRWTSSNETVATVNSRGEVSCKAAGVCTITATTEDGGFVAQCKVTVTVAVSGITLSKTQLTLDEGQSQTLEATISPADATNQRIGWESSDPLVATVENGTVTGIKAGSAVITATTEDGGKTASCTVTVIAHVSSISLDKASLKMERGSREQLSVSILPENASDKTVTWASSDPSVASVQDGLVTALGTGSTVISVTSKDGEKSASCAVTVVVSIVSVSLDKTSLSMTPGQTETLTATLSPSDATDQRVTWSSSSPSVATVDRGVVKAVSAGTATISVTTEDGGKKASCSVTVIVPVTGISLDRTSLDLLDGASATLIATIYPSDASNKTVRWSSSNPSVATVKNGTVTACNPGSCIITVTTDDGSYSATCSVVVKPDTSPSVWDGSSVSYDWYSRSTDNTYHIKTAAELAGLSKAFSQGYYKYGSFSGCTFYLDRDIDLANKEWTPIGTMQGNTYYCFAGTFDGNGHTIKGLKVTKANNSTYFIVGGLFGCAFKDGFSVKNLSLSGMVSIDAPSNLYGSLSVGGIIGFVGAQSNIQNCHSNVNIYSNATTGSSISVYTGGIVGEISTSSNDCHLEKCSSSGIISVTVNSANKARVGGIVGQYNVSSDMITQCSSSCRISVTGGKSADIGGIAGTSSGCYEVSNSIFSGSIEVYSSSYAFVGGIIADPFSQIVARNCLMVGSYYKSGGTAYMSAIFGVNSSSCSASDSYYISSLGSSTNYGTAISSDLLMSGSPLSGFDTSIWSFPSGSYPCLIFD